VHSQLGYHNKNHDTHLPYVLSLKANIQQNEFSEILNNERGIRIFKLSTNKIYNEWFKSIEQILNVLFKYKPKRNVGLLRCSKMTYFHLECQNLIKTSNNVLVFAPTLFIFFSKPLECKFVINKNNLIIFINTPFLWKNSKF
jgi:predicted alpha/beta-fold hydrolase